MGRPLDRGGRSGGETVAEHWQTADGLSLGRLVLKHVPVLCELAVFDADDIGGDPGGGASMAREPAMRDDVFALGDDELVLVFQYVGCHADQIEQAIAPGCDMRAVLDVAIRPVALGGGVVSLVE